MHIKDKEAVDVAVIGGGPAGCAAAEAAAREGARTLLVEQYGFLGGMATAGLVPAFCPYTDGEKTIIRGIGLEILEEMKAGMPHIPADNYDWIPIDAEKLKVILDRRTTDHGVLPLFMTHFVNAEVDNSGCVTGLVVHNKSGLQRYSPGVVIDCTGDADVVASAGGDFEKGDPQTGEMQPCTMCFVLSGIDNARFQKYLWANNGENLLLRRLIAEAKKNGDLDIAEEAANVSYQSSGTVGLNFSHVFNVDATDAGQLSQAHIEGRKLVTRLTEFIRKYCPGCENAYLVSTGVQIGVRETRRIIGDYQLTLDDYLARRWFDDEIARNSYYIDVHLSEKEWAEKKQSDWKEEIHQYGPGESHGVPYRCLVPRRLTNVLTAGRCISTDRAVQGSTRVMPMCFATGEAAGIAAALAVKGDLRDVRAIDVSLLRQRLLDHGQYLPPIR